MLSLRRGGYFWNEQNLIVSGKVRWSNIFAFLLYSLIYLGVQLVVFLNLELSQFAQINTGIITGIWAILPLFVAVLDFFFYGQRLKYYHIVGMVCLVACALCITFADSSNGSKVASIIAVRKEGEGVLSSWIPVVIGILAPLTFSV
mmetsp:Transcript_6732/g.11296  ORF Transcript_6732/g.11296 Transcript_6732/m.11296 type:complete len:146 (+) Transcript_6732:318-755(+)